MCIRDSCLSLPGVRKTKRYQNIEIEYYDWNWKKQMCIRDRVWMEKIIGEPHAGQPAVKPYSEVKE